MEFVFHSIKKLKKDIDVLQDKKPLILSISKYRKTCLNWTLLWPAFAFGIDKYLSANWTFSLLMSAADKVWITYWPWSTEILGQFIICMCQFIGQYDVTDRNNNISSDGLHRHYNKYPSWSYQTHRDISDKVCLNLQNCCYSIYKTDKTLYLSNIRIFIFQSSH